MALVAARGRLIEEVGPGAMIAVPLHEAELLPYLSADVSLASINAPAACILAGTVEGITDLERRLRADRVEARRLRFSHAPHSAMMDPILEEFRDHVVQARPTAPRIPLISSTTGTWMRPDQATDPNYWSAHLRQSVRFADGLLAIQDRPTQILVEMGPGRSLTALAKRPRASTTCTVIPTLGTATDSPAEMKLQAYRLAQCWTLGVDVDWRAWAGAESRRRLPLPTYVFDRQRYSLRDNPAPRSCVAEPRVERVLDGATDRRDAVIVGATSPDGCPTECPHRMTRSK